MTLHRMPEGLMSEEEAGAASAERDARERVEVETEKVADLSLIHISEPTRPY